MNVNDGLYNLPAIPRLTETIHSSSVQWRAAVPSLDVTSQDRTEASTAAGLVDQVMQMPDARLDKIAAIQQALTDGTYRVSSEDVADKLIQQLLNSFCPL